MIIGVALTIFLTIFAIFLTYLLKFELFFEERLAWGLVLGMVILGLGVFSLSLIFGLSLFSLLIFLIVATVLIVAILTEVGVKPLQEDLYQLKLRAKEKSWVVYWLFLTLLILPLVYLLSRLIFSKDGSLYIELVHAYGDISLHLSIISSFAYGANFPPQSPIFAGHPISYPFLVDFVSAVFVNPLNLSLAQAVDLTGVILIIALLVILAFFSLRICKSKLASLLLLVLFLFNGGLGFVYFFSDWIGANLNPQFLLHLPRDYTSLKEIGYWWLNVVISMLLPQRSFLFGLSIAIIVLQTFLNLIKQFKLRQLIFATLLLSLLPLIHTHSLIVLSPFLTWLSLMLIIKYKNKAWLIILTLASGAVVALMLSGVYLSQSAEFFKLLQLHLWWMANQENPLQFYIKNFGLSLILSPLVIYWALIKKTLVGAIGLISLIWLILPSLFLFQPWDFDNTKLFIYWYLFSSLVVSSFLANWFKSLLKLKKILAAIALILLVLSGGLDILRLLTASGMAYQIYSPQAIKLADFVKTNTRTDRLVLSIDKFDNPAVSLAGRKTIVGFHGWLWTYGLDFSKQQKDDEQMLEGRANLDLFKQYNIGYVLLFNDPSSLKIDKQFFDKNFKLIYNQDGYLLYELK